MTEITHQDPFDLATQIQSFTQIIRSANASDATRIWAQVKDVKGIMRVRNAAKEQIAQAQKLEADCLRRLGQLGVVPEELNRAERNASRVLADLTDEEYGELMSHGFSAFSACTELNRRWTEAHNVKMASEGVSGEVDEQTAEESAEGALQELSIMVADTLRRAEGERSFTSVDQVVSSIANHYLATNDFRTAGEEALRMGIADEVRKAMSSVDPYEFEETPTIEGLPRWVTFKGPGGEWLRIPTQYARRSQLAFMVEFREAQARELTAKAAELRTVLERLDEGYSKKPVKKEDNPLLRDME